VTRRYFPDFIVRVDDGKGADDPLNLIVEIKGYRGEDAKEKKSTMDTYWIPGVNHLGTHGRWAFAEFCDVYAMQEEFAKKVEAEFNKIIAAATEAPFGKESWRGKEADNPQDRDRTDARRRQAQEHS